MKTSRDHLVDLKTNLVLATDALLRAKFSSTRPAYSAAAALACNSIELGESIFHLSGCKAKAALPVLMRSLLESTMRLVLIAKDLDGGEASLELMDNLARLKLSDSSRSDQAVAAMLEQRNDELKAKGARQYSFKELLRHVGQDDTYKEFSVFSAFSHGQLSALVQHFFDRSDSSTKIRVNADLSEELLQVYYGGADYYVCITLDAINFIFHQTSPGNKIAGQYARLSEENVA